MGKKAPKTRAIRALDAAGVSYGLHPYAYVPRGGTRASSEALGVDEHIVVKTIVCLADGKERIGDSKHFWRVPGQPRLSQGPAAVESGAVGSRRGPRS